MVTRGFLLPHWLLGGGERLHTVARGHISGHSDGIEKGEGSGRLISPCRSLIHPRSPGAYRAAPPDDPIPLPDPVPPVDPMPPDDPVPGEPIPPPGVPVPPGKPLPGAPVPPSCPVLPGELVLPDPGRDPVPLPGAPGVLWLNSGIGPDPPGVTDCPVPGFVISGPPCPIAPPEPLPLPTWACTAPPVKRRIPLAIHI